MAYESGMPMHLAGATMTSISCVLFPNLVPLAVYMFLGTSNPGMINAAGDHWGDAQNKVTDLDNALNQLKKAFDADTSNWEGDDKNHFDDAVSAYLDELKKVKDNLGFVKEAMHIVALVLFILCIAVLTIGTILLALFIYALTNIEIPIIGEAIWAAAMTATLAISGAAIPVFGGVTQAFTVVMAFLGVVGAVAGGAYGVQFISLGTSEPKFDNVTIEMPPGPIKD